MSQSLTVQTPAKINPVLEVLRKRDDGYHELALVFQAIGVHDELTFTRGHGVQLSLAGSHPLLAADDSNLVVKAAKLFLSETLGEHQGVHMTLKKKIPIAAGLGGGSSDAAATLKGLDWFFKTGLSEDKLHSMASRLGSDVPFFLTGGSALGTGRGEVITSWGTGPEMALVVVKPEEGLSTPAVYQSGKAVMSMGDRAKGFEPVLRAGRLDEIAKRLYNGLEKAAIALLPEIDIIKNQLVDAGALGTLVSGSGPTVFALAESKGKAEEIAWKLEGEGWTVFVTTTVSTGVERI